ncbi:phage late control D family protein [Paenibacillus aceris]|uniref:Phage protein D n=1 Tax=Paenibacillus aceris TaxID=869555 RepID=A0ABS4I5Y4_9BACL|nr:contractile injection system protein, VgrG/Pvc8 family [Paenibacillus aceris]MBP1966332.1 phage protein D [Paenibacillus aceris]NHW38590.1 phage late control D family protein [Paenibacillus aceris]
MATLSLESSSFTYDDLAKKYKEFFSPAYLISVDGAKLTDNMAISMIRVETSIDGTADSFSFRITNAYDVTKNDFQWLGDLALGKPIDISLGYVDKFTPVFSGFITSVVVDFPEDGAPGLIVRGMDLSYLMMKGTKSRSWNKKKYSDIVQEIAKIYGAQVHVDATTTEYPAISQSQINDYHFIQNLANLVNYDFFVVGKHLYFRKPLTEMTPVLTLEMGKTLRNLTIDMNLAEQITGVKVRAWDNKELKVIEGESASISKLGGNSKTGKDILAAKGDFVEHVYTNVTSLEEAKTYASAILNRHAMKLISGSGECIGIPEIRAGRYIKLDSVGKKFNQPYYVTGATHLIDDDGYTTRFQIGGNAV